MATDNVISNPGTGGSTFRTFNDGNNVEWPASVVCFVSGGSANDWTLQQVDATHGLPVAVLGTVPVSGTVTVGAGSNLIGGVELVDSAGANKASISAAGAVKVDGSAVTQPVSGSVTANQGSPPWSVTVSGSLPVGSNTIGAVTQAAGPWTVNLTGVSGVAVGLGQAAMAASFPVVLASNQSAIPVTQSGGPWAVTPQAAASGGATPYHLVSAASTNATSVKASAGTVYSVQAFNTNASPRYLKFFDKASAPALGTDTPVKTILLPGNGSGAGAVVPMPVGTNFATGIAFAITGGIADNDATAVGAGDCVINFDYK